MAKYNLIRIHGIFDNQILNYQNLTRGYWKEVHFQKHLITKRRAVEYTFNTHFHPYVDSLIQKLIQRSVKGLQDADTEYKKGETITGPNGKLLPRPRLYEDFFNDTYEPASEPTLLPNADQAESFKSGVFVTRPLPVKDLDFSSGGAYSVYNWELFYHIPLTIALQLSKNQRYAEAQQWFHFIFDPTDDSDGPTPDRFWKVRPFHQKQIEKIEEVLVNLSTQTDLKLYKETLDSISAWKDTPFRPHIVARYRQTAYMYKAVMAYLDNLFAWGDFLFAQDTGETINEAMQLYVVAANILGPRPQAVPKKGNIQPQTYNSIRSKNNEFSSPTVQIENDILFDLTTLPSASEATDKLAAITGIGTALYFCVPRNEKLMAYWDTAADRLYKIRNSLNLQGIFRQLPLFDPPIDPGLLAKAAASGLDISSVVNGLNTPMPLVRFNLLLQKAIELCQEVKSLGNNLLSAFEKEDNETISLLRARHEEQLLNLSEAVRYAQWQESIKNREGIEQNIGNAFNRYAYYEKLLGKKDEDIKLPEIEALEEDGLLKNFKFKSKESQIDLRNINVDISRDLEESQGKIVSSFENQELEKLGEARDLQDIVQGIRLGGQAISLLPQFGIKFHFWGLGGNADYGGFNLGQLAQFAANVASAVSDRKTYEAGNAAKIGSYARREQDWAFQSNNAAGEITQMFKQLRAAQIREHIAEREWRNQQQQIKNAKDVRRFLEGEKLDGGLRKFSTKDFYVWMKREVKGLYGQYYQFAIETAKKAERSLQRELGDPTLSYIQPSYLAGKEGLLAGEKLYFDLKKMEMAYFDLNKREYEMTKHISLLQINPNALFDLRTKGSCTFAVPETAFDMDAAGHYFRRIKTVAVTIPCITGPYTGVHCTLTLTKSSIRTKTTVGDGYSSTGLEDERFSSNFSSIQSIVTSSAQNDSGLFETNLRDERYLPFEGSGVISEWQLELPAEFRQFDYETISDVILHMKYTSRAAGGLLAKGAVESIKTLLTEGGNVRLFNIRQEFPNEWHRFKQQTVSPDAQAQLQLDLKQEHFPYWSVGKVKAIKEFIIIVQNPKNSVNISMVKEGADSDVLAMKSIQDKKYAIGSLTKNLAAIAEKPIGNLSLFFSENKVEDLFLLVKWGNDKII